MFSVEFSCENGRGSGLEFTSVFQSGRQVRESKLGPQASVYRGVGVPSAAQDKKVHTGIALLASTQGAGKPLKYSLSNQMPSVDYWASGFYSTVGALALSRNSHLSWVGHETRAYVEGSCSLLMRCVLSNHLPSFSWVWNAIVKYVFICVYVCMCVINVFMYVWATWILLFQI